MTKDPHAMKAAAPAAEKPVIPAAETPPRTSSRRRELVIALVAVVWFGFFSLLGIDPHHDGVMLKPAIDVASGSMIFRDVFCQYGALAIWLQAAAVKLFGAELVVIKLLTALFYAGVMVLNDRIWRRFLSPKFALFNLVLGFALAPEQVVTFHPWSSVYALFFMLLALELLLGFFETGKCRLLFFSGIASAAAFLCRHPCGAVTVAALTAALLLELPAPETRRQCPKHLGIYWGGAAALLAPFALLLTVTGAWPDYIRQCVLFVAGFVRERGGGGFDFQKLSDSLFPLTQLFGFYDTLFTLLPLIVVAMLIPGALLVIHRRDKSLRRLMLTAALLLAVVSWHQYYPVPCIRHTYWAALPMLGAFTLMLQSIRRLPNPLLSWALLALGVLLVLMPAAIRFGGGAFRAGVAYKRSVAGLPGIRGMLVLPNEAAGFEVLDAAYRQLPQELQKRGVLNHTPDGLFSATLPDAGYPKPMFVNWGKDVYPDYPERAAKFVAGKRPAVLTTEEGDAIPFSGYFCHTEFLWNDRRFRLLVPEEFRPQRF